MIRWAMFPVRLVGLAQELQRIDDSGWDLVETIPEPRMWWESLFRKPDHVLLVLRKRPEPKLEIQFEVKGSEETTAAVEKLQHEMSALGMKARSEGSWIASCSVPE